ncbi:MAG: hypothetical protein LC624_04780, partial [Halobacteriales archaeon]|nr:hypothetical protein [Halobacteriales archaeon]
VDLSTAAVASSSNMAIAAQSAPCASVGGLPNGVCGPGSIGENAGTLAQGLSGETQNTADLTVAHATDSAQGDLDMLQDAFGLAQLPAGP